MNAKQAKQIPLQQILRQLGHNPAEENVWFDFGHGQGGNVLDFIMILYDITDVSAALKQLSEIIGISRQQQRPTIIATPLPNVRAKSGRIKQPQIEKIQALENQALIKYLLKRGIERKTAAPYVKEIYYSLREKEYFALAFPNLSGGYELRNPYFQGTLGKKDISLLMKRKSNRAEEREKMSTAVTLFEGFMDFLSALTFYQTLEAKTPVIVLNSVHLKDRAVEEIRAIGFAKIYLYLDRDSSGRKLQHDFRQQLGVTIIDKSKLYDGYKDFNEFLVQATQSEKLT